MHGQFIQTINYREHRKNAYPVLERVSHQNRKAIFFSKFKFSLNGGDLIFWFAFYLAAQFRPKMALTLEMRLEHLLRYLRALPTIRVHSKLDGRTLDIVDSLIS